MLHVVEDPKLTVLAVFPNQLEYLTKTLLSVSVMQHILKTLGGTVRLAINRV